MRTLPIIEQHFHGAFGVDFNKAGVNDILFLAEKLYSLGIHGFFPTLVTDSVANINRQIGIIKEASKLSKSILGVHLEGIFINPEKKGIHNPKHFMALTVENYKKVEDDFIKIVTLAPEFDNGLIKYLKQKGIKVQAGHCTGFGDVDGVTHVFNAMSGIRHRGNSTALSALVKDDVYTEVIADGIHVSDDALKLLFKSKPEDKVILISDSLPITYSDIKETTFADSKIFYDGKKATSSDGTIAGSTKLLPEIIKILAKKNMFSPKYIENVYDYHSIEKIGEIEWDEDFNIMS
ncbi:amidohydrolase family protein [bacterium]|nr:amidohydrolase family protein [bacterium]